MQRVIKFRVWDVYDEKMEIGTHVCYESGEVKAEDHDVLMQYTGLKDKNGKEIYDGDIVTIKDGIAKISWWDSHTRWRLQYNNRNFALYAFKDEMEIIGNIYENPELLLSTNTQ